MGCGASKAAEVKEQAAQRGQDEGHNIGMSFADQERLYEENLMAEERTRSERARVWVMSQRDLPVEEVESAIGQLCEWLSRELDNSIQVKINPGGPRLQKRTISIDAARGRALPLPEPVMLSPPRHSEAVSNPARLSSPLVGATLTDKTDREDNTNEIDNFTGHSHDLMPPPSTSSMNRKVPEGEVKEAASETSTTESTSATHVPMMFECEADELEAEADATTRNLAILKVMNLDMWKDYALRFEAIGKHKAGFSGSFGAKNLQPFLTRHASKSAVSGGTHEDIQHRAKAIQELEMHNSEDSDGDCMHNHELDTISEGSEPAPVGEDEMVALKKLKVCIGEKDRRNLRAQFDMMDSEHDKIGMNEFLYACHSIGSGLLPNEITKVFRLIDTEGNGQVDFDDFIAGLHGFTKYISVLDDDEQLKDYRPAPKGPKKVSSVPSLSLGDTIRSMDKNGSHILMAAHEKVSSMPDITAETLPGATVESTSSSSAFRSLIPHKLHAPSSPLASARQDTEGVTRTSPVSGSFERTISGPEKRNYARGRSGTFKRKQVEAEAEVSCQDQEVKNAMHRTVSHCQVTGSFQAVQDKAKFKTLDSKAEVVVQSSAWSALSLPESVSNYFNKLGSKRPMSPLVSGKGGLREMEF